MWYGEIRPWEMVYGGMWYEGIRHEKSKKKKNQNDWTI
jgi:hypothetical protein